VDKNKKIKLKNQKKQKKQKKENTSALNIDILKNLNNFIVRT
jgi:hypothetical protein